jgi:hypothetical protein
MTEVLTAKAKLQPPTPTQFKRVIDTEIRFYERVYRVSVAAGRPDFIALGQLDTLQGLRKSVIGKKLRNYGKQYRLEMP